jgi:hypothetical protein
VFLHNREIGPAQPAQHPEHTRPHSELFHIEAHRGDAWVIAYRAQAQADLVLYMINQQTATNKKRKIQIRGLVEKKPPVTG